jgi:CubicO group peptidase (beta-lactamase class C family)
MVSYDNLGDLADGRRLLIGDFRGVGRSQLLFNNAGDRTWWLGTFNAGAQAMTWAMAGHTSGFGDLRAGQMFWTGRFNNPQREQVLFYHPGDQNWWIGTFDDRLGRLTWAPAGSTSGFGNLLAGHRFWRGRFSSPSQDQILLYSPSDKNWWLGSWQPVAGTLKWASAGNTSGFGDLQAGQMLWTGRFARPDRDDMLMYSPSDQNWFLGAYDTAQSKLVWKRIDISSGFGNLLAGHRFWIGRFARTDRSNVLVYSPGDQNWWLATYDVANSKLVWNRVGITNSFGNLQAGHKFWSGAFSIGAGDQVMFYYPGDQNWWLSTYNTTSRQFDWKRVAITDSQGDARTPLLGRFSTSDFTEVLVQDPDRRRWWLGSLNDNADGLDWRMAINTDAPRGDAASMAVRARLREVYGRQVPGCTYLVTRNGRPFVDASFGYARRPGAADGELAMTASSQVHVGSITKFLACVAILRLIEEWNEFIAAPARPDEPKLAKAAHALGRAISLNEPVLPLVRPFLDAGLLASYGVNFPGTNVAAITLKQVLDHTSGLPRIGAEITRATYEAALNGQHLSDIVNEPSDDHPTSFDLSKFVTALLKQNATFAPVYNNDVYALPSAVIEATTGTPYAAWMKARLFADPRFDDIAPKVTDPARSARYYGFDGNNFTVGNHHPDYTDFSLAGGYFVSASAFSEWVEAVMQKESFRGRPILNDPQKLLTDLTGGALGGYSRDRYSGYTKNGAAGPGGGGTNASCAFMKGYGNERLFVFTEANAGVNADAVRDTGMDVLAEALTRRPGFSLPAGVPTGRLKQTVYWNDAAGVASATADIAVSTQAVQVRGLSATRICLLGNGPLAGGKQITDLVSVELLGSVRASTWGNHVFRLASDDGALLWLGDELMIDNGGDHGMRPFESEPLWMESNTWYPLRVRWYNSGGGAQLTLEWRTPGSEVFTAVPVANLVAQ